MFMRKGRCRKGKGWKRLKNHLCSGKIIEVKIIFKYKREINKMSQACI